MQRKVGVIVLLVALLLIFFFECSSVRRWVAYFFSDRVSAAAWMQFLATVIGLAVAIAVPNLVHHKEQRLKEEKDKDAACHMAELTKALSEPARFAVESFCKEVLSQKRGDFFMPREGLLRSSAGQLDQLISRGFGEAQLTELLIELIELRKMIDFCFDSCALYKGKLWTAEALEKCIPHHRMERVNKYYANIVREADKIIFKLKEA